MPVTHSKPAAGPFAPEAVDLGRLREVLASHGFLGDAVRDAVGARIGADHLRRDLPLYLRRLGALTPINTLIKLLTLGLWVEERAAEAALSPVAVDDLVAARLLERGPQGVRGLVELVVHRDLVLAHDRFEPERRGDLARDHVLGTNAPALLLDCLTVRLPVGDCLDLGCGGGVQSFKAARHCGRVVGVDTNARALAYFELNARLNGITNAVALEGDLFAPVAGRRFGLVVSNPPYVISPDNRYTFMDSGRPGDTICADVVRGVPAHLEEGGYGTVLCNWALREGEDWSAPLRRWVEGSGCDVWLLSSGQEDPLSYAAVWNRGREGAEYGAALDRWRDYYRAEGIAAIGMGAVILRRRSGPNWIRADVLPEDPTSECGEQIVRVFEAEDALAGLQDDDALLARAFRLVDAHRLDQSLRLADGRFVIEQSEIRLQGGFAFRGRVDAATLQLLQRCDGKTPLRVLAGEMERGTDAAEAGRVKGPLAAAVRRMVSMGFLVPE